MESPPLPLLMRPCSLSESWRVWTGRMLAASPVLKRHGGTIIECREDGWHAPNTVSQMQHCCFLQILHRSPRCRQEGNRRRHSSSRRPRHVARARPLALSVGDPWAGIEFLVAFHQSAALPDARRVVRHCADAVGSGHVLLYHRACGTSRRGRCFLQS